jgi:hypothetical protein
MADATPSEIKVRCPCGEKMNLPAAAAGKKARCPACEAVFSVPASAPAAAVAPSPMPVDDDDGDSLLAEAVGQSRLSAPPPRPATAGEPRRSSWVCPKCHRSVLGGGILCTECGYNIETGKRAKAAKAGGGVGGAVGEALGRAAAGARTFARGCLFSGLGALVGAAIWCGIAIVTEYEIGWIAWGLGALAGVGMLKGYGSESVRAGLVAALIAVVGIVGAKAMVFFYVNYDDISQVSAMIDRVKDESSDDRDRLASHRTWVQAFQGGWQPDDGAFESAEEANGAAAYMLSDDELRDALAEIDRWEAGAKWEDAAYTRGYLIDVRTDKEVERRYPEPSDDASEEEWDNYQGASSEERRQIWQEQAASVDAMTPAAQLAEAREIDRRQQREIDEASVMFHRHWIRVTKLDQPRPDEVEVTAMQETERKAVAAMSDEELAKALADREAWDDGARWNDEEYLRCWLIQQKRNEALGKAMSGLSPEEDGEAAMQRLDEERKVQHLIARSDVDAMPREARLAEAKRIEEKDKQRSAELSRKYREEQAAEMTQLVGSSAAEFFFENYFGGMDVLFFLLAVASAFKIASTGGESE